MIDLRKILIIFVIAVLFSVFVVTSIEAVYPTPKYENYCRNFGLSPVVELPPERLSVCPDASPTQAVFQACNEQKGFIDYKRYDSKGCAQEPYCNTCQSDLQRAQEKYNLRYFVVAALAGLLAIGLGVYLPSNKNTLHEWIGTGFMLGGIFVLFFGTIRTFGDLHRYVRPAIIFGELVIVIFLSYKKLGKEK